MELLDSPAQYKGREITMELKYNGGGIRDGDRLESMTCNSFGFNGNFNIELEIPKDTPTVNVQPGQYILVTFVFSGDPNKPSVVKRIARP